MRWVRASLLGAVHAWAFNAWGQAAPYWPGSAAAAATRPNQVPNAWSQVIARTTGRIAADLYVDGKPVCRLPCQVPLPSGMHVVAGHGPDGSSAAQRIYFAPGAAVPILLDVVPLRAVLRVTAAIPGTLVYLDGMLVGNTNWQGSITPGPHRLQLRRPSGEQVQQALTVKAGMTYDIRDSAPARSATTPPPSVPPNTSPQQRTPYDATRPTSPVPGRYGMSPSAQVQQPRTPPNTAAGANPSPYSAAPSGGPASSSPSAPVEPSDIEQADRYRGMTGALILPIMLGGASTNDYGDHCPATPFGGYCTVGGPRGAAIAGRLGYAHDWIAPELTIALSLDISSGGMRLPNDAKLEGDADGILTQIAGQTKFIRIGILGGLGVRVASQGRGSRFTLSGSLGLVKRHVYILPDSFFGQKPSYAAKSLFFDAGVLLGDTPGAKIYAGLFAWFEFVPTLVIERDVTKLNLDPALVPASLRRIAPFSGTQFMFGPLIGVTFGH